MKKFFALAILLTISACTKLREIPIQASFEGISSHATCEHPTNLLIVHGLGGYSKGDPCTLINGIQKRLGLTQVGDSIVRHIYKDDNYYGCLIHTDYEGLYHSLRIYNLYWYQTTDLPKSILDDIDMQTCAYRTKMIRDVKKKYVNNTFTDALLYVSDYRKEIQYPFEVAFELIENETRGEDLTVIGFSLAGTIVMDTLDEMPNRELASNFLKQIKQIFLLSNPNPLFELTEWTPFSNQCTWNWQNWSMARIIYEKRKYDPEFKIIAISDPNDAFSYIASANTLCQLGWENTFQNILVRNVKWSYFGFIDPVEAHTGYGKNKKVIDLIIFGSR